MTTTKSKTKPTETHPMPLVDVLRYADSDSLVDLDELLNIEPAPSTRRRCACKEEGGCK